MTSDLRRAIAGSLMISALVWTLFTWPLILHLREGIPASHQRPPHETLRRMVPGDHLQLLYHFWLAGDMLAGRTPLFHNPYEFNDGDDDGRREPGAYYAPFSLLYAAISTVGGRALGWNLAGFISIWLTALFTWRLAARLTASETAQGLAAFVAIAIPFRWMSLLGGSPTGFAMAWVPLLALGLYDAVAHRRIRGGNWAALALIASATGDAHVFFFSALSTPLWILLGWAKGLPLDISSHRANRPPIRVWIRQSAWALAPMVAGAVVALVLTRGVTAEIESAPATERTMAETALFSPRPEGLVSRENLGISNQAMMGWFLGGLLIASLGWMVTRGIRRSNAAGREHAAVWVAAVLLGTSLVAVILLALGPWGPRHGLVFRAARRLIPSYRLIRQAAKVYALLPTLSAMTIAAAWSRPQPRRRGAETVAATALAAAMLWEYRPLIRPHICLLRTRQGAYAAVAEETKRTGNLPRALALPLWPGDSHYSSVYQYYASLYHLRLVNGYRPFVPAGYIRDVFQRLESLNQGEIADDQLDALLQRGIRHILFHEDLFPEKVSPFPAGATLARLCAHPRLAFVARDGPVWAFRVRPADETHGEPPPPWASDYRGHFPAWRWSAASLRTSTDASREKNEREAWVRLSTPNASAEVSRPLRVARFPGMRWRLRMRGHGAILFAPLSDRPAIRVEADADQWTWIPVAFEAPASFFSVHPRLTWAGGAVDVSVIILEGEAPEVPAPGETVRWPASWFFRAGWSEPDRGWVCLEPAEAPNDEVFYGPRLPLPAGEYEVTLRFASETPNGVEIGRLRLEEAAGTSMAVRGSAPARLRFSLAETRLFCIRFLYLGNARIVLEAVELSRATSPSP